jgi:preprotein translocase subunit SecG
MSTFFQVILLLMAVFLILIILVQRGRGGGLAGALGGPGGSSAFGAKAGDAFTKITMWTAGLWILMCILAYIWGTSRSDSLGGTDAFSGLGSDRPSSSVIEDEDATGNSTLGESDAASSEDE